ncbi:hypothetical protein G4Y73_08065 [Wenzhouxiangella sp. XN201]|nr:hypothetical protein [Wenzhouxiangella sp. XN201]
MLTVSPARLMIVTAVLALVFQELFETVLPGRSASNLDEVLLVILFCVALWIQCASRRLSAVMLLPPALFVYLFWVSAAFGVNRNIYEIGVQSLLHVQLFFAFVAVFLIERRYRGIARLSLELATFGSLLGLLLQIIFPGTFEAIFGSPFSDVGAGRYLFDRFDGVQRNPNALGVLLALSCVVWFFPEKKVKSLTWYFWVILLVSGVALTGSRTAMMILIFGAVFSRAPIRKLVFITLMGTILLSVTGSSQLLFQKTESTVDYLIETPVEESRYTRWVMAYYGARLAATNFPIGTGSATFGSALAHESDVYQKLEIDSLPAVIEGRVQDSNVGSIMGEFGVLGMVLFLSSLVLLMQAGASAQRSVFRFSGYGNRVFLLMLCIAVLMFGMRPFFNSSYYGMIFSLAFFAALDREGKLGVALAHPK